MTRRILYRAALILEVIAMIARAGPARARVLPDPKLVSIQHQISGDKFSYQAVDKDTSDTLSSRFGEPQLAMFPDGSEPQPGESITIDNRHVAIAAVDDGIVINIPQRMLFVFRGGRLADAWPVTIGRPDWPTPLGSYTIASREMNPTWHIPPAIRAEMEDDGIAVPDSHEIMPGPRNPLGQRWIGLDHGGIGIHGTNHWKSIFYFGSHGCIRLAPEGINKLFPMVKRGEAVEIVYVPVSLAILPDGRIFLESDPDPYDMGHPDIAAVRAAARGAGVEGSIDWRRASRVLVMVEGIARRVDVAHQGEAAELTAP